MTHQMQIGDTIIAPWLPTRRTGEWMSRMSIENIKDYHRRTIRRKTSSITPRDCSSIEHRLPNTNVRNNIDFPRLSTLLLIKHRGQIIDFAIRKWKHDYRNTYRCHQTCKNENKRENIPDCHHDEYRGLITCVCVRVRTINRSHHHHQHDFFHRKHHYRHKYRLPNTSLIAQW